MVSPAMNQSNSWMMDLTCSFFVVSRGKDSAGKPRLGRQRPNNNRAGAVGFEFAVRQHVPEQIKILRHAYGRWVKRWRMMPAALSANDYSLDCFGGCGCRARAASWRVTGRHSMATFYDTHGHLDYPDFAADFPQVLERAQAAGIRNSSPSARTSPAAGSASLWRNNIPRFMRWWGRASQSGDGSAGGFPEALRELARHPRSSGWANQIDYYRLPADPAAASAAANVRAALFTQHLVVAAETGLNCVIHQRAAFEETFALFQPFADRVRGVFHCFADGAEEMRRVVAAGPLVSFTGILTFKNGRNIRDTLARC